MPSTQKKKAKSTKQVKTKKKVKKVIRKADPILCKDYLQSVWHLPSPNAPLSNNQIKILLECVSKGISLSSACKVAGINHHYLKALLNAGKQYASRLAEMMIANEKIADEDIPVEYSLYMALAKATGEFEKYCVDKLHEEIKLGNTKIAAWMLEKRLPKKWSGYVEKAKEDDKDSTREDNTKYVVVAPEQSVDEENWRKENEAEQLAQKQEIPQQPKYIDLTVDDADTVSEVDTSTKLDDIVGDE